jgi:two-component system NtrC family sensor kinase
MSNASRQLDLKSLHPLLLRQIQRYLGDLSVSNVSDPQGLHDFLMAIDQAYQQFDEDHALLERSLELSSEELLTANTQLQQLIKSVEVQVESRTQELLAANAALAKALEKLKATQMQLIQTEKMSSLGQLVAGVAHEINNPINFIYGNLEHAEGYINDLLELIAVYQQWVPPTIPEIQHKSQAVDLDFIQHDLPRLLASMEHGTDRIREIVMALRTFSRMDESDLKYVDIHQGIKSTILILESKLKAAGNSRPIDIVCQYGDLPNVECYAGQLNQVFMNLLSNAIDALHDKQWATNEQHYRFDTLDLNHLDKLNLPPALAEIQGQDSPMILIQSQQLVDDHVRISIADNGPGISPQHQQRLFDPFFTTKPVGQGTGLGLSISYQLITERHRGRLTCFSIPNVGTEFTIEIPMHQTQKN